MRIGFRGELKDEAQIRAGFIGCGSHSFRNIFPALQFAHVELVAVCDLVIEKAKAFAEQFAAKGIYSDYEEMIRREELDAVFVVVGYDEKDRPIYPEITCKCLAAGVHVWIEKPPAASCRQIEQMQAAAEKSGKNVVVGFKKAFAPANQKAKAWMEDESFGNVALALFQYPQGIPTAEQFNEYVGKGEPEETVCGFLDHLCHPVSLMLYLLGMPETLFYQRSRSGAGAATFTFASGSVATLALSRGVAQNTGTERTVIVSDKRRHIVVENNLRVMLHRGPRLPYGESADYYASPDELASLLWEPEFSLGQLYNKGLFLLGYYNEVEEFAQSVLQGRPPANGTLQQAWQVTRIFEAFAEGPGRVIAL